MKKLLFVACFALLIFSVQSQAQSIKSDKIKSKSSMKKQTIYQFKVEDLSGNKFDFATLKGKKVLIVNTASKCGFTPQYEQLEAIYKEYKDKADDKLVKEIQEHVKMVTAPYKYPRIIEFVDTLPKTISGKIRRTEIRERDSR